LKTCVGSRPTPQPIFAAARFFVAFSIPLAICPARKRV
jgi:hypothetical protein